VPILMPDVVVTDNPAEHRYEIRVGGELAGEAVYRATADNVVFLHTEIDPAFEGEGLGGQLAAWALDDVRRQHKTVTPSCPFIAGYIERHPAYADLLRH
jgi:predicted GNAT family acetyltransferase